MISMSENNANGIIPSAATKELCSTSALTPVLAIAKNRRKAQPLNKPYSHCTKISIVHC